MSELLSRARMLRQHRRHEEAVSHLIAHLSQHPQDGYAFVELALNRLEIPGAKEMALENAREATGLMPEEAYPLALQARILADLDREKEGLPLANAAIALEPEDTFAWNSKAIVLIGLKQWKEAEECARTALSFDPDDETASNLLAHILRIQNRLDESEEESRRRLARDPENAFSFANAGWAALQRGKPKEAEDHFKEALRLNPEMEHAREGLKESYRARSAFYRAFLKWAFFLQRFSQGHQMAIFIGIIIGFRVIRTLAKAVHPMLVLPLVLVYYIFIFGSWLAGPVANLLILKDRVARLSLNRAEKWDGIVVGGSFLVGLVTVIVGLSLASNPVAAVGGILMIFAIPMSLVITNESMKGRVVFGACAAGVLLFGGIGLMDVVAHPARQLMEGKAGSFFVYMLVIAAAVTWLGSVKSLRQRRPD